MTRIPYPVRTNSDTGACEDIASKRVPSEPDDHAIGRSRGGLTTKTHLLADGRGRAVVIAVSPGQAGDNPALAPMLAELRVPRLGPGRPGLARIAYARTRPTPPAPPARCCGQGHRGRHPAARR